MYYNPPSEETIAELISLLGLLSDGQQEKVIDMIRAEVRKLIKPFVFNESFHIDRDYD